jgi:DNA-3-methyladenine glycosylase I
MSNKKRCRWVSDDPIYVAYHDKEWGVPVFDDQLLFEYLNLEGAQAGLSWITVLKKRDNYRKLFNQFDPCKIAKYDAKKIEQLIKDPRIIRHRLKIEATVINAKAYLRLLNEWESFSQYIWHFVDGKPLTSPATALKKIPTKNAISDAMSKDLKKRGFKFVGSTICYAFMQAVGMVNDHAPDCFRYKKIK